MPKIIIHHPDGSSAKYGLNGPSFTIGRASGNDIILPAGAASSHHAVLKMNESGDFTVTDLESTNKTKVNGRAVQTSPLRNGDNLMFGDISADYQSEITPAPYQDDQPTQLYESRSAPPDVPGAAPAQKTQTAQTPLRVATVIAPQVIARPASTTARRSTHSSDEGCFALIVFAFVLPAAFFTGLVIRHHQEKGEWLWNYVQNYLNT